MVKVGRKIDNQTPKKPHLMKSPSLKLMEVEEKMKMGSATTKVNFVAWKNPLKGWDSWVINLCSTYQSTWKNAGIYEAVMSSMYAIKKHDELIFELASKWCSKSNTFVFPWGEATLTLEDMLVLGGFSASGLSALSSQENDAELLKIEEQLELARLEASRSKAQTALLRKWIEKFRECGSELEHAAFLSLWLSRFVFPVGCKSVINKNVFPIAARLSKGIKIALGPAVLAKLYGELTVLTNRLRFSQLAAQSGVDMGQINFFAPFHLVQVWAWERFPMLKPILDRKNSGENNLRIARWSNVKILKDKDLKSAIDSAEKDFLWCPYGAFGKNEGKDLEALGHCMKISELVGFDACIEKYQPQRVARQFGLNQDIPIDNIDASDDVKLCPPRFSPGIEVIDVLDSDSDNDDDCNKRMKTEASERAEIKHDEIEAMEDQLVQLQDSNLAPQPLNNEAMNSVNESVHGIREGGGEVVDSKLESFLGAEKPVSQAVPADSSDAESSTSEGFQDWADEMDARLTRLENFVHGQMKALEASEQATL